MGRVFTISWPKFEKAVEAELMEEQDPKLCQDFCETFKKRTLQKVCVIMRPGRVYEQPDS